MHDETIINSFYFFRDVIVFSEFYTYHKMEGNKNTELIFLFHNKFCTYFEISKFESPQKLLEFLPGEKNSCIFPFID